MKNITTLLFATLLFVSCNQQKTKTMEPKANEQLIKTYFKHFNNHDWKAMAQCIPKLPILKIQRLVQEL